ncbi:MAG TPA: NAD-dependent epimerase/dehydratase family protein [Roseiflexaceae bacterium]|nr:NAD-dependent epimerase/dehydratase family protein [Roseiflexaceae bacterium]
MHRVLITGANGHIGANLIRSLLRRGYEIVPLVRHSSDTRSLDHLGLTYAYGDVMDRASLVAAAQGCDAIIHTAAVFAHWALDPATIIQPALSGTRNIFFAAQQAGIRRMIYTSSMVAIGFTSRPTEQRSEHDWNDDPQNPYTVAKRQSEQEALHLAEELQVPTIRLCPGAILGPYDYRGTPSMNLLADTIINSGLSYAGGLNIVDVRDVAETHALALDHGEPGQRYCVGGTNVTINDIAALVAKYTGIKARPLPGGRRTALVIARLLDGISAITRRPPAFSYTEVYENVERYGYIDSALGRQVFGITPRSLEETVRDSLRWLLHIGALKPQLASTYRERLQPDPEWLAGHP